MLVYYLHVLRTEGDLDKHCRDKKALQLFDWCTWLDLGSNDLCIGQPQQLVDGDPSWNIGWLGQDVKAEGLRCTLAQVPSESHIVAKLLGLVRCWLAGLLYRLLGWFQGR